MKDSAARQAIERIKWDLAQERKKEKKEEQ